MPTTYSNQSVTLCKDLIFGWTVLTENDSLENAWMPLSQLSRQDLELVWRLMDTASIFPDELIQYVRNRLEDKTTTFVS